MVKLVMSLPEQVVLSEFNWNPGEQLHLCSIVAISMKHTCWHELFEGHDAFAATINIAMYSYLRKLHIFKKYPCMFFDQAVNQTPVGSYIQMIHLCWYKFDDSHLMIPHIHLHLE